MVKVSRKMCNFIILIGMLLGAFLPITNVYATDYNQVKDWDIRTENALSQTEFVNKVKEVAEKNGHEDSFLVDIAEDLYKGSLAIGVNASFMAGQLIIENGWVPAKGNSNLENFNYGNLRGQGDNGTYSNASGSFASFKTKESGVKAYLDLIHGYVSGKSPATATNEAGTILNTLEKVIWIYAPPTENNSQKYVLDVVAVMEMLGQDATKGGKFIDGTGEYAGIGGDDGVTKVGDMQKKFNYFVDVSSKDKNLGVEKNEEMRKELSLFSEKVDSVEPYANILKGILVGVLIIGISVVLVVHYTVGDLLIGNRYIDTGKILGRDDAKTQQSNNINMALRFILVAVVCGLIMANVHLYLIAGILYCWDYFVGIVQSVWYGMGF